MSPGARFRQALKEEKPLQIIGTICAYHALMAKRVGYRAVYLSGGGVAAGSLGMPDLGISNLDDVLIDIRRITDVCDLPLLVDVDTGFGASAFNVARTIRAIARARSSCPATRCATASRRRWMREATNPSSSWRAPMRSRAKVWILPFQEQKRM
jgi:2-methylisocitrate lyase-like PEP mutase family enzyme